MQQGDEDKSVYFLLSGRLNVEFENSNSGKIYGAQLLGITLSGAGAYRYHYGRFNLNAGLGLRYSTIDSSITSNDSSTTADTVYGGIGIKFFLSAGMAF